MLTILGYIVIALFIGGVIWMGVELARAPLIPEEDEVAEEELDR